MTGATPQGEGGGETHKDHNQPNNDLTVNVAEGQRASEAIVMQVIHFGPGEVAIRTCAKILEIS